MPESQKRQIAYKVRIKDILNGKYIKEEGWKPNYVAAEDGRNISRINLIGVIVDKQFEFEKGVLVIDDGSGKIMIRSFDDNNKLNDLNIGEAVLIIGRPREYNNEMFIMPEIIKKIKNDKWIDFRRLELEKNDGNHKIEKIPGNYLMEEIKEEREKSPSEKIFDLIRKLDLGNGAEFDEVVNMSNIKEAEKIINNLLIEGEIFQNKPGRLKVLE